MGGSLWDYSELNRTEILRFTQDDNYYMEEAEERAENLKRRLERLLSDYRAIHEEFKELEKEGVALNEKIRRVVDTVKMQKIKSRISQINEN